MRTLLLSIIIVFPFAFIKAQVSDIKSFYVGHSLTDYIGEMIRGLSNDDPETTFEFAYQQILGSPLRWQWEALERQDFVNFPDADIYAFYDADNGLPAGDFTHLVLTESVPRHNNEYGIGETYNYLDSFYLYAIQDNPAIRPYLYEVWHCIESGTPTGCDYDVDSNPFRQRLTDDLPMWESAVDTFNARNNPAFPMKLIPAGQALGLFYDKIHNGEIPGITNIEQVFDDNIHGNDTVRYLVTCVHYATLFERSPVGLTNELFVWWGGAFGPISQSLAAQLQEIAWETVCNYEPLGINCGPLSVENAEIDSQVRMYPNPASGKVTIAFGRESENVSIRVIDVFGRDIYFNQKIGGSEVIIDMHENETGIYFVEIKIDNQTLLNKLVLK